MTNESSTTKRKSIAEWDRLLAACQKNQPNLVRTLIEVEGTNPSHANRVGQSALHIAALWGHVECVKVLLELGANVHAANGITGGTPLHCVMRSSNSLKSKKRIEVTKILLEKGGANTSLRDMYGKMPLDYLNSNEDVFESEEDKEELSLLLRPGIPPIFKAISNDDFHTLKEILEKERSSTTADDDKRRILVFDQPYLSRTPLTAAMDRFLQYVQNEEDYDEAITKAENTFKILELLVAHDSFPIGSLLSGPDDDDDDDDPNESPLHRICLAFKDRLITLDNTNESSNDDDHNKTKKDTVIELLRSIAQVFFDRIAHNNTDESSNIASSSSVSLLPEVTVQLLHDAARRGRLKMIEFLIQTLNVDPNTRGRQGMTPLQFAARSGKIDVVKYLLTNYTIDVTITDDRGQTALDAAKSNNREDIINILEEYVAANLK